MANWTVEEALRMALRLEVENHDEYQKEAQKADSPAVREMFLFLAAEEKKHIALIKERMAGLGLRP